MSFDRHQQHARRLVPTVRVTGDEGCPPRADAHDLATIRRRLRHDPAFYGPEPDLDPPLDDEELERIRTPDDLD